MILIYWWRIFAICGLILFGSGCAINTLDRQVELLYQEGEYEKAIYIAQESIRKSENEFGGNHPQTGKSLNNLAELYRKVGRYDEAMQLHIRAQSILMATYGPKHPHTAMSMNNLAGLYETTGHFEEAAPLYRRALEIVEEALGPFDPETEKISGNLGLLYWKLALYDESLPLLQRAVAVSERKTGLSSNSTAAHLDDLGKLYHSMGRYDEALHLFQRAVAIKENNLGTTHGSTAKSLNNLAVQYNRMGRYDEALPLFRRALAINEKALQSDPREAVVSLSNLATWYFSVGRNDEALSMFMRALAEYEQAFGSNHPEIATLKSNLAYMYYSMGRHDDALLLNMQALEIRKRSLGPDHPDIAVSLNNLATLYLAVGRSDEALPLLRRSRNILEKALGPDHPDTATSLSNLAWLYQSMGRHDEALPLMRQAVRALIAKDISVQRREFGAIDALARGSSNLGFALQLRTDPGAQDEAIFYYKLSVNTRQRMRAGTRGLKAEYRESVTKNVAYPYQLLSDLLIRRGRIAEAERVLLLLKESELTEYLRRNGSDGSQLQALTWTVEEEAYRQVLDRIAGQWREFDQRRVAVMDGIKLGRLSDTGPEMAELDQRRLQLETQTANVMADATQRFAQASQAAHKHREQAFDIARTQLSVKLGELRQRGDGLRTAGLVLSPSERGLTLIVTTEQGAVPLMRQVSESELGKLVSELREAIQHRRDYKASAQALYRHLIEPAEAQLGGAQDIQQWVILPFGNLRALPFAALLGPDGTHLIERYAVTLLTADGTGRLDGLDASGSNIWSGVALGASQPDADFGNVALPGVRREVCGVIREPAGKDCQPAEGIVTGKRYLDAAFTPALLQRMLGPLTSNAQFLHIATHFKAEKSQLLLGDGSKLTTRQILGWTPRLGQYDLIALSACDSGISDGAVESLGGVLRAHGAKAVLATLWPVADIGAAPLMVEFYRQRGETRAMSKAAALREAQRAMIAGRIKDDSGKADLRQPYFWAPYVLMGNWL